MKIFEERLNDLGIYLSPLTTDDESDIESTEIAAREREASWKSKPILHVLFAIAFDTRGCCLKQWLD